MAKVNITDATRCMFSLGSLWWWWCQMTYIVLQIYMRLHCWNNHSGWSSTQALPYFFKYSMRIGLSSCGRLRGTQTGFPQK